MQQALSPFQLPCWVNRKDRQQIMDYGSELTLMSARSCDVH